MIMKRLLLLILLFYTLDTYSQSALPVPDHIVVVILENHAYTQIIGSPNAPTINALASSPNAALFTQSYAIEHPSQPNYLDLYSGCNQGVTDDKIPVNNPFTTVNLGRQLIDAGRTFITYSEDLPSVGYNGELSGKYVRKHNPAANWMGTGANQIPPTTNQPFTSFPATDFTLLPTVSFVIANLNNIMHDGSIAQGDQWISNHLMSYIQWSRTHNSLFILTFDEDDNKLLKNHIVTLFSGQMVLAGDYSELINHYNLLRTIEEMFGLPYAGDAVTATTITGCWIEKVIYPDILKANMVSVTPNPAHHRLKLEISKNYLLNNVKLTFINTLGVKVKEAAIQSLTTDIDLAELSSGIYVYQLLNGKDVLNTGKIIVE